MASPFLGEFMGTLVLILLGDGVVANVVLKRSKAEGSGWIVITAGWAFAVMAGVFTAIACGSNDAYLNPAVTLGFAVSSGHFSKFAPYLAAEMLGAFVGAIVMWVHYYPHWRETPDPDLKRACFCTSPAIRLSGRAVPKPNISSVPVTSRPSINAACSNASARAIHRRKWNCWTLRLTATWR